MAQVVTSTAAPSDTASAQLATLLERRPAWPARRVDELRRQALERFKQRGLPAPREEAWRHTRLAPLREERNYCFSEIDGAAEAARPLLEINPFSGVGRHRLVFVDGRYVPELSARADLPEGVRFTTIREALQDEVLLGHLNRSLAEDENPFVALNTAGFEDGAFIHVQKNTVLKHPLEIIYLSLGVGPGRVVLQPRTLVVVEAFGEAPIIELHLGGGRGRYFSNPVAETYGYENAQVDFLKVQVEDCDSFHFGALETWQDRNATVRTAVITLSGGIVRNDTGTQLDGEGGYADLDGLYLASGDSQVENFTRIEHRKPHCGSREVYKGILNDRGRGLFRGRIVVWPGAQKTDSKQTNRNLLLSREALVNTKPQLEIYADDVKCTHGATIGQLDAEALFYLRSRGIPEPAARSILIYAFAGEVVERLHNPELRGAVDRFFLSWLPEGTVVEAMAQREEKA